MKCFSILLLNIKSISCLNPDCCTPSSVTLYFSLTEWITGCIQVFKNLLIYYQAFLTRVCFHGLAQCLTCSRHSINAELMDPCIQTSSSKLFLHITVRITLWSFERWIYLKENFNLFQIQYGFHRLFVAGSCYLI